MKFKIIWNKQKEYVELSTLIKSYRRHLNFLYGLRKVGIETY